MVEMSSLFGAAGRFYRAVADFLSVPVLQFGHESIHSPLLWCSDVRLVDPDVGLSPRDMKNRIDAVCPSRTTLGLIS